MKSRRIAFLACALMVFLVAVNATPQESTLKGDPKAVELAARLLSQIGGAALWARTRTLQVKELSHTPEWSNIRYEAWRDLETPRRRSLAKTDKIDRQIVLDGKDRWGVREGQFYQSSAEATASDLAFWPGDIYVVYHRLAKADPRLTVKLRTDRAFEVHEDEKLLCWFELSAAGEPIRWVRQTQFEKVEYVYGPMMTFGQFRMPAWGATLDGNWRFNYHEISSSAEPLQIPLKPQAIQK